MNTRSITVPRIHQKDMSFDRFYTEFFQPEQPVIIAGATDGWGANQKWNAEALLDQLKESKSTVKRQLWYDNDSQFLREDYAVPAFVERSLDGKYSYTRDKNCRFWIHPPGNVTPWHYDGNYLYVFNVQVKGAKEWWMVSPETPLASFPFSNITAPFSCPQPSREIVYATFVAEEGDMVFLPPLWAHRVLTVKNSINLNWVGTKKGATARSKLDAREKEILKLATLPGGAKLIIRMGGAGSMDYFNQYGGGGWPLIRELTADTSAVAALARAAKELAAARSLNRTEVNGANVLKKKVTEPGPLPVR
ncbi:MAG TPA: cupin domain-containing protein [Opitutaceae bacterium]|nr:cupin domain-containing protein [Opitutaceae bacterium]